MTWYYKTVPNSTSKPTPRGGTKSSIFHMTFSCIPMRVIVGVSPYCCCAKAKKLRDHPGISSSNIIASIADHSHIIVFVRGSQRTTCENLPSKNLLCKVCGDNSDDTAFLFEHVIISYILWPTPTTPHLENWACQLYMVKKKSLDRHLNGSAFCNYHRLEVPEQALSGIPQVLRILKPRC